VAAFERDARGRARKASAARRPTGRRRSGWQEEEHRGHGGGRWSAGMDRGGGVEEVGTGRPSEWTG